MPDPFWGQSSSAQAWFAGGERVGYDPKARAMVLARAANPQDLLESGGRSFAGRLLPAGISRRLIRRKFGRICRTLPRCRNSRRLCGMGDSDLVRPRGP
jgi:hypothetical protein